MRLVIAFAVVIAACTSDPATPTTAPPDAPSTTTTIVSDTCERLIADTADYLEVVLRVLDDTTLDELRDREAWPEALVALQRQGEDLDARAAAMRCDAAAVQEGAFDAADLDADGPLAQYLLELLGRG